MDNENVNKTGIYNLNGNLNDFRYIVVVYQPYDTRSNHTCVFFPVSVALTFNDVSSSRLLPCTDDGYMQMTFTTTTVQLHSITRIYGYRIYGMK